MPFSDHRPVVTLSFAQSIDAKIGRSDGTQFILSGKESMLMTHKMRSLHDGILIGIGTALNDDPQLNVRHLPITTTPRHLPQPIILDTHLRLPITCKLLQNYQAGTGLSPWVICQHISTPEHTRRKSDLEAAGARVLDLPVQHGERPPLSSVLQLLRLNQIESLMVEGGAQIIEAFMSEPSGVVDAMVITVSPQFLGTGVTYRTETSVLKPRLVYTEALGNDTVFLFNCNDN